MWVAQVLINALVLGCLYACIAIGFSLVWGVLNVINLIHGSFIVLGAYLAWGLYQSLSIPPWYVLIVVAPLFFILGYLLQRLLLNRVITAPVLVTLTLTFGLDLILNNAMIYFFKADYRKLSLSPPVGSISLFDVVVPVDRLIATGAALALTGCAGVLMALIFPISPLTSSTFLGKAFVVCVLGGLGSVSGALAGGLLLALVEGVGSTLFGPSHATTLSFVLLIVFLILRPQGLLEIGRAH